MIFFRSASRLRRALIVVSALLSVAACSGQKGAPGPTQKNVVKEGSRDVVVATLGAIKITAGQVADALARQPEYVRMRFSSPSRKKVFLEKLLRFEVLVAEARRRGLDKHPDVLRREKRAMVDILMKKLNQELVSFDDISEAEVKARYERDKAKYQRPAQARAAVVILATEAEAKKVLAEVAAKNGDPRYFAKICAERNKDPELKKRAGDLGFFGSKASKPVKVLRDAVFALPKVGRVAGPLKVEGGWALIMKTGLRPAMNHPLVVVRDEIKNRLFHEKRFKAVTAYADNLRKKAKLEIDEAKLAAVKIPSPQSVSGMNARPGMGTRRPLAIPRPPMRAPAPKKAHEAPKKVTP